MNHEWIKSLILIAFGLTMFVIALSRLRRYRLKERYALLFIFLGTPFLVLAIWPAAVGKLSEVLHIQYNTVSLLCVTAFLLLMVFELLTIVSIQDRKINTLSQIVGILMQKQGISDTDLHRDQQVSVPSDSEDR
jgi:hypothetical protein